MEDKSPKLSVKKSTKKQKITILLEEYKRLRDVSEEYQALIGKYNLLATNYNSLIEDILPDLDLETEDSKEKRIGFGQGD